MPDGTRRCECGCGMSVTNRFVRGHVAGHIARLRISARNGDLEAARMLYANGWWSEASERMKPHAFGVEAEFYGVPRQQVVEAIAATGVEVEDDGYHHQRRNYWRLTDDSSLYGTYSSELVSPVLSGTHDGDVKDMETVLNVIRSIGGKVNRSDGLHVHHNARSLSTKDLAVGVQTYAAFQRIINDMVAPTRIGNGMCREMDPNVVNYYAPYGGTPWGTWGDAIMELGRSALTRSSNSFERYVAVNLQALAAHGTVEFRQHQGTLEPMRVLAWTKFTESVLRSAYAGVTLDELRTIAREVRERKWSMTDMFDRLKTDSLATRYYLNGDYLLGDWEESQAYNEDDPEEEGYDYYCDCCGDGYSYEWDEGSTEYYCAPCARDHAEDDY